MPAEGPQEAPHSAGAAAAQVCADSKEAGASNWLVSAPQGLTGARLQDYLVKHLLEGIPALGERVQLLREREQGRRGGAAAAETDAKSQTECVAQHTAAIVALSASL